MRRIAGSPRYGTFHSNNIQRELDITLSLRIIKLSSMASGEVS